ncbi:MAG: hypothetical protein IBJ03_02220 [Gemmatimonadaceae bacterium]|nr:hypothetical protein [Gemmatimonadaceae bacterium]
MRTWGAVLLSVLGFSAAVANPKQLVTDIAPILRPETVPWVANQGGEYVFSVVADTMGRIEADSVLTLVATDSLVARALRERLHEVRYLPGRVIESDGQCVRANGRIAHCGGSNPRGRLVRRRVLLQLELTPTSIR